MKLEQIIKEALPDAIIKRYTKRAIGNFSDKEYFSVCPDPGELLLIGGSGREYYVTRYCTNPGNVKELTEEHNVFSGMLPLNVFGEPDFDFFVKIIKNYDCFG